MPNSNANPLRRIAEEAYEVMVAQSAFAYEKTDPIEQSRQMSYLPGIIETALRGVVNKCVKIASADPKVADAICSHFLTPEKPTEKEPQQ